MCTVLFSFSCTHSLNLRTAPLLHRCCDYRSRRKSYGLGTVELRGRTTRLRTITCKSICQTSSPMLSLRKGIPNADIFDNNSIIERAIFPEGTLLRAEPPSILVQPKTRTAPHLGAPAAEQPAHNFPTSTYQNGQDELTLRRTSDVTSSRRLSKQHDATCSERVNTPGGRSPQTGSYLASCWPSRLL